MSVIPGSLGSAKLDEVPDPGIELGSILVEALAVGVCGTDVESASGLYGWPPPGRERLILGHESLGRFLDPASRTLSRTSVPAEVKSKAMVQLAGGVPFVSDADLRTALDKAGVPKQAAGAIVDQNAAARLDGLRSALSVLAVIALIALPFSRRIPARQPASAPET